MKHTQLWFLVLTGLLAFVMTGCGNAPNEANNTPTTKSDSASVAGTNEEPPLLMDNTVLKPLYIMDDLDLSAGTAFAVTLPEADVNLVVTCLHVFGPAGGLMEFIDPEDLPKRIVKAKFKDAFSNMDCGEALKVLPIPEAKMVPNVSKDIAAFYYEDTLRAYKLKIADQLPKVGDSVWLAAYIRDADVQQRLYKGVVDYADDTSLSFLYDNQTITISGTSGAPILNGKGEVVGINIASDEQDGKVYGIANPCTSFKKMLLEALQKK